MGYRWVVPFAQTVRGFSVASDGLGNTAVGACMRSNRSDAAFAGNGYIGTITSATACAWKLTATPIVCAKLALHPFDKDHFIYTNATWGSPGASVLHNTWKSTDGGATVSQTNHPTEAFHAAIDQRGIYYTGAEAGAFAACFLNSDRTTTTFGVSVSPNCQ